MNKRGFTLIELLAVIVILAIIALIATPIVLNIIKDSRESAGLRSAEMYLDALEQSVSVAKMKDTNFNPSTCTVIKDGNLNCEGTEVKVEVNGEVPQEGSIITFESGKIKDVTLNYSNSKTIVKNTEGSLVYSNVESGSGAEQETLAPGLYKSDGTFVSWEQLTSMDYQTVTGWDEEYENIIEGAILTVDNGVLTTLWQEEDGSYLYLEGKLVISNEVSSIGIGGLMWNELTEIVIPNSVTRIEARSFELTGLSSIDIPSSVGYIGSEAFGGTYTLNTINYSGTIEQWNSINMPDDWYCETLGITVHCTDGDIIIPEWVYPEE